MKRRSNSPAPDLPEESQTDALRALATHGWLAEQRERRRLARVVHDHLQQLLVLARMQLNWAQETPGLEAKLRETLDDLGGTLEEAVAATRALTAELSPPILHEAGLAAALGWLADRLAQTAAFQVHLQLTQWTEPASEELKVLLFDGVRELLNNCRQHAGVAEAWVELQGSPAQIRVRDEGRGFDPPCRAKRRGGRAALGLFGLQQRLQQFGGRLLIEAAPGQGACITLILSP